jgi:hypothetical protein
LTIPIIFAKKNNLFMSKKIVVGEVVAELFSGNDAQVETAIEKIQENPSVEYIQPLLALFFDTNDAELKERLSTMMGSLKVSGFEDELMQALRKPEWKMHRGQVMAFMWNAGGNPVEFVRELTEMAVEGGMETLLECYSILDTMEGPLLEAQLIESQTFLHENFQRMQDGHEKQLVAMLSNVLAEKEIEE